MGRFMMLRTPDAAVPEKRKGKYRYWQWNGNCLPDFTDNNKAEKWICQ